MTIPLPRQNSAWLEFGPSQMEISGQARRIGSTRSNLLQKTDGFRIKIAESVDLQSVGKNPEQEVPGKMDGRRFRKTPVQRARKPFRSRPRRCAISSSRDNEVCLFLVCAVRTMQRPRR